jgi:O-antigen/teichoic acid export membrane protein
MTSKHLESSIPEGKRSEGGRADAASRNAILNFTGYIYPLALTIVVTPILVHRVGTKDYGVFALATSLVGFLGLLDFGMGTAAIKYGAHYLARESDRELDFILGSNLVFFGVIGGIGFAIACCFAGFGVQHIVAHSQIGVAQFAFVGAGIAFWISMLANVWSSIPQIVQRYGVVAFVSFATSTVGAILSVGSVLAGLGLRGLIIATVAQPIISLTLFGLAKPRLLPRARIRPRAPLAMLRKMFSFSGYAFATKMSITTLSILGRFVLGGYRGTTAVTYYTVPSSIAQRLIHGPVSQLTAVLLPASSDLHARGDKAALRVLYTRATRLIILVVLSIVTPAMILSRRLLELWLGSAFAARSAVPFQLLLVAYLILALSAIPYYITFGIGRPRVAALFCGLATGINIALIFLLVPRYGVVGAATSLAISVFPILIWIFWLEREILGGSRVWLQILARVAPCILIEGAIGILLAPLTINLLFTIAIVIVTVAIAPTLYLMTPLGYVEDVSLFRELLPKRLARLVPTYSRSAA